MIRKPIGRTWTIALGVASILILLGAYTTVSAVQHLKNPDDRTIPLWSQIVEGVVKASTPADTARGEIWLVEDTKATFGRLFGGLAVGVLASIVLGMLMGTFTPVEAFLLPPLKFLAKIPPTALMAIFFVLAGIGFSMYVAMIAFGVLPTLTQSIYLSAKRDVPDELVFKSYTLGASHVEVIWNVIFRQVLPDVIESIRLQIGPAMVYLIAAEMLVASVGIGYRIRLEQRLLNMSVVYYYVFVLGAFGFVIDYALRLLVRKACPWYHRTA
jgi:NitT/TauT family transport system permease protein